MVLVSYILYNHIGILQTQLSDREGHEARRGWLEAMPLHQEIERGPGERQARLKRRPAPVPLLLHMADQRQPREHRLDEHASLPRAALTQWESAGIASGGMEGRVTQDSPRGFAWSPQPLKGV